VKKAGFIRAEGFNIPPFRAVKKVLNPECNYLMRTTWGCPKSMNFENFLYKNSKSLS
jgi:hypothetical protein